MGLPFFCSVQSKVAAYLLRCLILFIRDVGGLRLWFLSNLSSCSNTILYSSTLTEWNTDWSH